MLPLLPARVASVSACLHVATRPKRYAAILIDPPWSFNVWSKATGHGRSAESHYPTMTPQALKALPLQTLMADDCAVFMWATFPTLPQALDLGASWGLTYKTCAFLWAKINKRADQRQAYPADDTNWFMGMGYWTRANAEPCLLFTRGNPKRKARNVRQLIASVIRQHSQKPDQIYGRIEQLVDGPYLEVFARQAHTRWDAIGNGIDGRDIRDVLGAPALFADASAETTVAA